MFSYISILVRLAFCLLYVSYIFILVKLSARLALCVP